MILDSLLSVRLVTATGDIVTASTTENPDLFWAIRGAGFNYGIVVEATFRVYDLTSNLVTNADLLLPLNASSQILQYLKSFEDDMPDKLAIIVYAHYSTTYKQVSHHGCEFCFVWSSSWLTLPYFLQSACLRHQCSLRWARGRTPDSPSSSS